MTLQFPDHDLLRFALTSGLVPADVALAPARAGVDDAGRPWVSPLGPASDATIASLRRVGVTTLVDEPTGSRAVAHWPQVLPLRRQPVPPALTGQTPVLLEFTNAAAVAPLVAEMLRLGNDRQGIRWLSDGTALLRVVGPPYFSLLRAIEGTDPEVRAYVEHGPRVWIAWGCAHPLGERLAAPEGQSVLIRPPAEWAHMPDAPFADIYDCLDYKVPGPHIDWTDSPPRGKLTIPLRLVPAAGTDPPELWVVTRDGPDTLDTLVRDADDRLLTRLAFAVGERDGQAVAILRSRPGKDGPPGPVIASPAYRSYSRLPNLFLPLGMRLNPPLRREAVRSLLANDPTRVTWLEPAEDGSFTALSLPDEAFRPLSDWVEYVMDRDADRLRAWLAAARFDFATLISKDELVPARAAAVRRVPPRRTEARTEREPRAAPSVPATMATPEPAATPAVMPAPFQPGPTAPPSELQVRLKAAERAFVEAGGPLDSPTRRNFWPELARLNTELQYTLDAATCWLNALWDRPGPPAEWTMGWVRAERALVDNRLTEADLDRLMVVPQPSPPDVRALAAVIVWATSTKPVPSALASRGAVVHRYLEQHDRLLPVRAAWLAWVGLTRATGADVLALARARDRLLNRLLTEGLSPERDLPTFLRFAGQRDSDRLRVVRDRTEQVRQAVQSWFADSGTQRGTLDQTAAYIDLMFAFGMARLGESQLARSLLAKATGDLGATGDEGHAVTAAGFRYRIEQVIDGRPHVGPLPTDQIEYVDHLRRESKASPASQLAPLGRAVYAVERLREQSRILEPQERFDPYRYTQRDYGEEINKELAEWPDVTDPRRLGDRIRQLLRRPGADRFPPALRLKALADGLTLAPRISEAFVMELLDAVPKALDSVPPQADTLVQEERVRLVNRALFFAAHYDDAARVQAFVARLNDLFAAPPPALRGALSTVAAQSLRSLRKLGLRDEAQRLLQQLTEQVMRGRSPADLRSREPADWPLTLRLLLRLAAGWLEFDRPEFAVPIFDEARLLIAQRPKRSSAREWLDYVAVIENYVAALGHWAPLEALDLIQDLFAPGRIDRLPNTYTSSSHFSRLHLNITEAVVLALASEEFALGPAARRWLDEDEYLVRRRIHADVRAAVGPAGSM